MGNWGFGSDRYCRWLERPRRETMPEGRLKIYLGHFGGSYVPS